MTGITHEYNLIASGPLPLWAGLVLACAISGLVIWVLRREAGFRKRGGTTTPARIACRVAFAVLLVALVVQPVLYIRRIETRPGQMIVVADRSRSMLRVDPMDATMQLNLAAELGKAVASGRPDAAEKLRLAWAANRASLVQAREQAAAAAGDLSRGMPPSAAATSQLGIQATTLEALVNQLQPLITAMGKAGLPAATQPKDELLPLIEKPVIELGDLARTITQAKEKNLTAESAMAIVVGYDRVISTADAATQSLVQAQLYMDRQFLSAMPTASRKEVDAIAAMSRFDLASAIASKVAGDAQLAATHRVTLRDLEPLTALSATPHTDLFGSIETATPAGLDDVVSGVVLLSDGQQNLPERPEVMSHLEGRGIPFVAVGVGSDEGVPDVAVMDYESPGIVQRDKKSTLTARIKTQIPEGSPITVSLALPDGQVLGRTPAQASASGAVAVNVDFRLADLGHRVLTLGVAAAQPDSAPENDTVSVPVFVMDRQPRALVIGRWARWDLVHVAQALANRSVRADTIFWGQLGKAATRGSGTNAIPDTLESLRRYQLVILDGAPFEGIKPEDEKLFSDYVSQGGNVLVIQSEAAGYSTAWPWLAGGKPALVPGTKLVPGAGTDGIPLVQLSADSAASRSIWASLAPVKHATPVPAQALPLLTSEKGEALMSLGFRGRGKIYLLGVSDLFHMRNWSGGPATDRFLAGLVDDALIPLSGADDAAVALYPSIPRVGSDAIVVSPTPTSLSLRAAKLDAVPLAPITVNAAGSAHPYRMTVPAAGRFELASGEKAIASGEAIRSASMEDFDFQLSPARLKAIAATAHGIYAPLTQAMTTLRNLPGSVERAVTVRQFNLGAMIFLLPLMAAILTLDWYLRRKAGLVL